jgi:Na+/melibiose symporter-like transporter
VLTANHRRVQRLTPTEVWLFIVGRVLAAFGVGILFARYQPRLAGSLAWPAVVAGVLCLVVAARGLRRPALPGDIPPPAD